MAITRYKFTLPLQTEEALRLFLKHAFGVAIPDVQVCPGHTPPWRIFCDAYFNRHRVMVIKASRGLAGKSFLLSHLGLLYAATQRASVTLLGGSGEQSRNLHRYMADAWQYPNAPRSLLVNDPLKMETALKNGASVRALLASSTSIRGPHPQKLLCDEADEMDWQIFTGALGQPMGKPGIPPQTIISSTHHYPDGTMSAILKMAAEKGWPVAEYCYRETMRPHGWLDPAEVDAKRADIPAAVFEVEFDLQQPSAEGRAIMPEAVFAMFDPALGTYDGRDGEYIEIEPPQPGARYQTGADWARKADHTIIVTVRTDVDPMVVVAFERLSRRAWPQQVARFEQRLQRYPGTARHDGTGLGDVVSGYLTVWAEDVLLVGRTRADLFSDYINLIEQGGLVSADIRFMHQEHQFCAVDDLYGRGHPPDSFVAGALAAIPSTRRRWLPIDDQLSVGA
jgi:hypothetical protein